MKRIHVSAAGIFIVCLLLSLKPSAAFAQQATELPVHPGETLRYEIKFDGPDAAKVRAISLYLGRTNGGPPPSNQPGFRVGFNGNQSSPTGAGTFRPEITIPPDAANGNYLLYVNAYFAAGMIQYTAEKDFQLHPIHIVNPMKITSPTITVSPISR